MKSEKEITGHTRMICLLGSPVAHSLSPQMHNAAFAQLGLDYRYLAFDVKPQNLKDITAAFKAMGVRGMNLTMPLKNDIVPLCDRLSPASRISGSVNTVVFEEDGSMSGHTTDGIGFFDACRQENFEIRGKKMTLFGTGGAGTAILVQGALDGAREISVFSRSRSRFADRLNRVAEELRLSTDCSIRIYEYTDTDLARELGDSDLLCNASNVGMAPDAEKCLISDPAWLPASLTVADVIYNPQQTRLLKYAAERGCRAFNGMYMLLYQGAASFRLWTGQDMPTESIREIYFS